LRASDLARLVALAAIWGASFLFMRVAVGPLGAIATAETRLVLAGATIALYLAITGKRLEFGRHWRHYAIVGTLNSAAPFALFAWSAQHLPASYLAVINATAPLFGALVAALWLAERITPRAALGLAAGVAGVATLVGLGPIAATPVTVVAALAGLAAALCYAIASGYVKRESYAVDASALAGGSNVAAAAVLVPLAIVAPPAGLPPQKPRGRAGSRRAVHRDRVPALLPANHRCRTVARAHRHLPDPGVRDAVGRGLPRRSDHRDHARRLRAGARRDRAYPAIGARYPRATESSQAMRPSAFRSTSCPYAAMACAAVKGAP
jgi:uncharacterized membrane protein